MYSVCFTSFVIYLSSKVCGSACLSSYHGQGKQLVGGKIFTRDELQRLFGESPCCDIIFCYYVSLYIKSITVILSESEINAQCATLGWQKYNHDGSEVNFVNTIFFEMKRLEF